MDCHGLPKKLQALQPTLVFVLLSHHNGLQYQVEPFFRQTSLIYAHLAPETDFELATLPRGPPIFRFGFQKKILVCSRTEASPVPRGLARTLDYHLPQQSAHQFIYL